MHCFATILAAWCPRVALFFSVDLAQWMDAWRVWRRENRRSSWGRTRGQVIWEHSLFVSETKEFRNNDRGFVFFVGIQTELCIYNIPKILKKLIWKNELAGSLVEGSWGNLFLNIDMDTVSWVHCLVGKCMLHPQKRRHSETSFHRTVFILKIFRDEIIHPDPFIMNCESRLILKRQISVFFFIQNLVNIPSPKVRLNLGTWMGDSCQWTSDVC